MDHEKKSLKSYFLYLFHILFLAAAYYGLARVGLAIDAVSGFATLVWAPTGIAFVAILLHGYRLWPGIFLGAVLVNFQIGGSLPIAGGIGVGNTAEALVAVYLLRRAGFNPSLEKLKDVFSFVVLAALVSTLISATVGTTTLWIGHLLTEPFHFTWIAWWVGDMLGDLIMAPFMLAWTARGLQITRGGKQWIEVVVLFSVFTVSAFALFAGWAPTIFERIPLGYIIFFGLIWASLRFGLRGSMTAIFMASIIAIWMTTHHFGLFATGAVIENLFLLQLFMGVAAVTSMMTAAVVSEHKKAEAMAEVALNKSEEKFRVLTDTAFDAIISADQNGNIIYFNKGAERIFGYDTAEVLGKSLTTLMPEKYREPHRRGLEHFRATGQGRLIGKTLELEGTRKDGKIFPLELSLAAWMAEDQIFFTSIIRDISDRKQIEDALHKREAQLAETQEILKKSHGELEARVRERTAEWEEANTKLQLEIGERKRVEGNLKKKTGELEQSNRELDDFAYVASHDLKEPLRGIANYARFILEDYGSKFDAAGKEKLETLMLLPEQMEKLLDNLLAFSRLGRTDMKIQDVDLHALLQDVLMLVKPCYEGKNLKILTPRPLPTVACDSARIREVFHNLITNAVKYNDKPEMEIEIGYNDPVFHVRDNGIGINQKYREDVFRMFKRLHPRDAYGGGTGAGLSIVKKIVESHGGKIWLESVPGTGTTFYFTLASQITGS